MTLQVDTNDLRIKAKTMSSVRTELAEVRSFAEEIALTVGEDRLANHVRDIGSKWDLTRSRLLEQIEFLENSLNAIAETYEDLDRNLAKMVEEQR